jgi:hypothetical protein
MHSDDKNCPYCGEVIKSIAIKCKHCKSELNNLSLLVEDKNLLTSEILSKNEIPTVLKYELIPHGYVVFIISFLIIGIFVQLIVANSIFETGKSGYAFDEIYDSSKWIFLYTAVNSIFSILDFYNLKRLGIQVKYGLIAALSFTPVYLYFRGNKLNEIYKLGWVKSQSFFIGWIIIFAISIPIEQYLLTLL